MITNHKQLVNHNLSFFEAIIDAKVHAWKEVSRAYNAYTMNYFKDHVEKGTEIVEGLGKTMKESAKLVKEV